MLRDNISTKIEDGAIEEEKYVKVFGGSGEVGSCFSPAAWDFEANQRRRVSAYREVLQSYDELRIRSENLKELKSKILRY